jgi:hypothetical protein
MAYEDPNDVIRLATAANPFQAHVWQQMLEREGIKSQVVGDYLSAGLGDIPGVRPEVWVHRDDQARAEIILREGEPISEEDPSAPENPPS